MTTTIKVTHTATSNGNAPKNETHGKLKLYHFTRRETLSSILADGLNKGDFPLSSKESINAVNLTSNLSSDIGSQDWVAFLPEKLGFRLTVEVPTSERLMKWKFCVQKFCMEHSWVKGLNPDPYNWWVCFGVILPSQIVEVFDIRLGRALTASEIESIKQQPHQRGVLATSVPVVELTFEQALQRR